MVRLNATILISAVLVSVALADKDRERGAPETFLVQDNRGLAFLGANGAERERMEKWAGNGAFSPDGRWLACVEFDRETSQCKLLIRSREKLIENESLPLVWGTVGNGYLPVWSADSKRLLIGENRAGKDGSIEITYRVFELPTKRMTELKLPEGHWVGGWSQDGKRFLTTFHPKEGRARVAWVDAEGAGKVMFITPEDEPAYDARLSPDNRRILYVAGHQAAKEERNRPRLYSMELSTKKRTTLSEPGATNGYCWSPKGDRVAYTWQPIPDKLAEFAERKTLLLTCDPDGRNRKLVTTRKYEIPENSSGRSGVVIFFQVMDWQ